MGYFQKEKAKRLAEKMATTAASPNHKDASQPHAGLSVYEQMLRKTNEYRSELKQLMSVDLKAARKAEIIPEFEAYIEGVLKVKNGQQDDVLMRLFAWMIDARQYEKALEILPYAIEYDFSIPDIDRTPHAFMTQQMGDDADAGNIPSSSIMQQTLDIVADLDMADPIKAKLYRYLGEAIEDEQPDQALAHFHRATQLNANIGLKTRIKKLEKTLNQQTENNTDAEKKQTQPEPDQTD